MEMEPSADASLFWLKLSKCFAFSLWVFSECNHSEILSVVGKPASLPAWESLAVKTADPYLCPLRCKYFLSTTHSRGKQYSALQCRRSTEVQTTVWNIHLMWAGHPQIFTHVRFRGVNTRPSCQYSQNGKRGKVTFQNPDGIKWLERSCHNLSYSCLNGHIRKRQSDLLKTRGCNLGARLAKLP